MVGAAVEAGADVDVGARATVVAVVAGAGGDVVTVGAVVPPGAFVVGAVVAAVVAAGAVAALGRSAERPVDAGASGASAADWSLAVAPAATTAPTGTSTAAAPVSGAVVVSRGRVVSPSSAAAAMGWGVVELGTGAARAFDEIRGADPTIMTFRIRPPATAAPIRRAVRKVNMRSARSRPGGALSDVVVTVDTRHCVSCGFGA